MILYEDGYIRLDYDAGTDVLCAICPHIEKEELLSLHKAFSIIVKTIISFDIRNFLLDASHSQTTVTEDEYFIVMEQLVQELKTTPLKKLARVVSPNPMREETAARYIKEAADYFPYEIQNFSTNELALNWLKC